MTRIGVTGIPDSYHFFGTFAGLPFWGGGLTLLSAAPGIGKTSWMLRMLLNAAAFGPLRQSPGRTLLAVIAIALGVLLGLVALGICARFGRTGGFCFQRLLRGGLE